MTRLPFAGLFLLVALATPAAGQSLFFGKDNPLAPTKPEVSAFLVPTGKPQEFAVEVRLVVPPGANTYSQSPEFSKPTEISAEDLPGWTPLDAAFAADHPPKRSFDSNFGKPLEKFTGTVIFYRRYRAPEGIDPKTARFTGLAKFLICDQSTCKPHSVPFETTFSEHNLISSPLPPVSTAAAIIPVTAPTVHTAPTVQAAAEAPHAPSQKHGYEVVPRRKIGGKDVPDPLRLQFELVPPDAQMGQTVTLAITMTLADGWNTYGLQKIDDSQLEMPTKIQFATRNLKQLEELTSEPPPEIHTTKLGDEVVRSFAHRGRVTWKQKFLVAAPGEYGVEGKISYQVCREGKCQTNHMEFSLGEGQRPEHLQGAATLMGSFADPKTGSGDGDFVDIPLISTGQTQTLAGTLVGAFLAGLIMNLLPCVLPVLAIKILSLVEQAGESRTRIIGLNTAYTLGVMSVFFALAVLSWGLGQSLASAFQNSAFMTFMACVVFTMGLSLFGVFELPVPGIIPSAHGQHEGYLGAFNTGIIATILGTPCIGPLVSPFFAWTLAQPAGIVFLVFGMMGLGMASPYLLTGLFPSLVNWLPKPGMWMVRFKQFTGFVMMGTTIFLLFSIDKEWQIPVLVLLLALALLVWMGANLTSPAEPLARRWKVYLLSLITTAPIFLFGLMMMRPDPPGAMPWVPYSEELITELRAEGRPMLIDFTANWCVNCKVNERVALNREETINAVKELGVTPILADFTKEDDEIRRRLNQFDQDSVPLTVIIPPGKDSQGVPLRGLYTKRQLLAALREAIGEPATTSPVAESTDNIGAAGVIR